MEACHSGPSPFAGAGLIRAAPKRQSLHLASQQSPCYGAREANGHASCEPFAWLKISYPGVKTRVDISGGIQASLSGRYALALFELANEQKKLETVGKDLAAVKQALGESDVFRALTTSPLVGRDEAMRAVAATAAAMKLDTVTANFLGVLARNRRLAQLPAVIRAFNQLAARHRGEITAEVTSAHALDAGQVDAIRQNLRSRMGRDIAVDLSVDPAILGGLVVKIGSQMIDGSIRTKLNNLAQVMKG
jgi:F-type H+-transporting ATPase subunit delta